MKRAILTTLLAALAVSACTSELPDRYVVKDDPGGSLIAHKQQIAAVVKSGKPLEIHGKCESACTMYLGYPENICIDRDALFGFHSAFIFMVPAGNHNLTRYMTKDYPKPLKKWFWENVGSNSRYTMHHVPAAELMRIVPDTYRYCD